MLIGHVSVQGIKLLRLIFILLILETEKLADCIA